MLITAAATANNI